MSWRARASSRRSILAVPALLGGCRFPRDANSTLERVRAGTLQIGVAPRLPFVTWRDGVGAGPEADLAVGFARRLGASAAWREGALYDLVPALGRGDIDLLLAGLTPQSRYASLLALSQAWGNGSSGEPRVLAVRPGESAFLLELDRYLAGQTVQVPVAIGATAQATS